MKKVLILLFSLLIIMGINFNSNAQNSGAYIKIYKKVTDIRKFGKEVVHPNCVLVYMSRSRSYVAYNVKTGQRYNIPSGFRINNYEKIKYYRDREYKSFSAGKVCMINPEKNEAGFLGYAYNRNMPRKSKYRNVYFYTCVDLETNSVKWTHFIGYRKYVWAISPDKSLNHLYYYYKKAPFVYSFERLNLSTKQVDWKYDLRIKRRYVRTYKGMKPPSLQTPFFTKNYENIVATEYDEAPGKIKRPIVQTYIINVAKRKHYENPSMITAYGQVYDNKRSLYLVGSNQLSHLIQYYIKTAGYKKIRRVRVKRIPKGSFHYILSSQNKYVYVLTKTVFLAYTWPGLRLVKRIPISRLFPGIPYFSTSESMWVSNDRKYAAIGIMKKRGRYISSDRKKGFYVLEFGG